jgi:hypothetical protein
MIQGIDIGAYSAIGEWILFETTFLVRYEIAKVIDYTSI